MWGHQSWRASGCCQKAMDSNPTKSTSRTINIFSWLLTKGHKTYQSETRLCLGSSFPGLSYIRVRIKTLSTWRDQPHTHRKGRWCCHQWWFSRFYPRVLNDKGLWLEQSYCWTNKKAYERGIVQHFVIPELILQNISVQGLMWKTTILKKHFQLLLLNLKSMHCLHEIELKITLQLSDFIPQ